MSDAYNPTLVHLPGTKLTPEVVLHRTLDKLDRIKAVAVVIQWEDGSFDIDWSLMKATDLCAMSFVVEDAARVALQGGSKPELRGDKE